LHGSGGAPFRADIGIRSGKIAAVGSCGEAAQTLDAAGRYVTPGFLDIHRHGDAAVFRPGFGRAELRQGLTTIVNGHTSAENQRERLIFVETLDIIKKIHLRR